MMPCEPQLVCMASANGESGTLVDRIGLPARLTRVFAWESGEWEPGEWEPGEWEPGDDTWQCLTYSSPVS